ncbi:aldehyde dehydrogenase family protein, partial [Aneurinibacillus danicus]|uniref:aldehyde dehydrogenase family protein n=1 Tax=Aneurinibacillus danicus TaxID=267746 RepID=UPI0011BFD8D6
MMTIKSEVKTYQNLIGGEWVAPQSDKFKASINPADYREIVGYVPLSTERDVDNAVQSAKTAFADWRRLSGSTRGEYLRKTADIIEQR